MFFSRKSGTPSPPLPQVALVDEMELREQMVLHQKLPEETGTEWLGGAHRNLVFKIPLASLVADEKLEMPPLEKFFGENFVPENFAGADKVRAVNWLMRNMHMGTLYFLVNGVEKACAESGIKMGNFSKTCMVEKTQHGFKIKNTLTVESDFKANAEIEIRFTTPDNPQIKVLSQSINFDREKLAASFKKRKQSLGKTKIQYWRKNTLPKTINNDLYYEVFKKSDERLKALAGKKDSEINEKFFFMTLDAIRIRGFLNPVYLKMNNKNNIVTCLHKLLGDVEKGKITREHQRAIIDIGRILYDYSNPYKSFDDKASQLSRARIEGLPVMQDAAVASSNKKQVLDDRECAPGRDAVWNALSLNHVQNIKEFLKDTKQPWSPKVQALSLLADVMEDRQGENFSMTPIQIRKVWGDLCLAHEVDGCFEQMLKNDIQGNCDLSKLDLSAFSVLPNELFYDSPGILFGKTLAEMQEKGFFESDFMEIRPAFQESISRLFELITNDSIINIAHLGDLENIAESLMGNNYKRKNQFKDFVHAKEKEGAKGQFEPLNSLASQAILEGNAEALREYNLDRKLMSEEINKLPNVESNEPLRLLSQLLQDQRCDLMFITPEQVVERWKMVCEKKKISEDKREAAQKMLPPFLQIVIFQGLLSVEQKKATEILKEFPYYAQPVEDEKNEEQVGAEPKVKSDFDLNGISLSSRYVLVSSSEINDRQEKFLNASFSSLDPAGEIESGVGQPVDQPIYLQEIKLTVKKADTATEEIRLCAKHVTKPDGGCSSELHMNPVKLESMQNESHLLLLIAIQMIEDHRSGLSHTQKSSEMTLSGSNHLLVALMDEYCSYKKYSYAIQSDIALSAVEKAKAKNILNGDLSPATESTNANRPARP